MQLLILWFFLFSTVLSCSSTDFDSVYDDYPDCAASCLGCRDETYYSNFANNCNYSSGDCCTSQYHNSIAQTWDCVSTNCGNQVSKDAFKTFVTFCKDNKTPLEEKDVPSGYELSDGDDKKNGGKFWSQIITTSTNLGHRLFREEKTVVRNMANHHHFDRRSDLPCRSHQSDFQISTFLEGHVQANVGGKQTSKWQNKLPELSGNRRDANGQCLRSNFQHINVERECVSRCRGSR